MNKQTQAYLETLPTSQRIELEMQLTTHLTNLMPCHFAPICKTMVEVKDSRVLPILCSLHEVHRNSLLYYRGSLHSMTEEQKQYILKNPSYKAPPGKTFYNPKDPRWSK